MSLLDDDLRKEFFEEAEEEIELYDFCILCGSECDEPVFDNLTGKGPYCDNCYDDILTVKVVDVIYPGINFDYPVLDIFSASPVLGEPQDPIFSPDFDKYNPPMNN